MNKLIERAMEKLGFVSKNKYERQTKFISRINKEYRKRVMSEYKPKFPKGYNILIIRYKNLDLLGNPILNYVMKPKIDFGKTQLKMKSVVEK